jgi:hypothetical protein
VRWECKKKKKKKEGGIEKLDIKFLEKALKRYHRQGFRTTNKHLQQKKHLLEDGKLYSREIITLTRLKKKNRNRNEIQIAKPNPKLKLKPNIKNRNQTKIIIR